MSQPIVLFSSGYLSVHIYLHIGDRGQRYYDVVLYRKIKGPGGSEYKRGANLKPSDVPHAITLLNEANQYLKTYCEDYLTELTA